MARHQAEILLPVDYKRGVRDSAAYAKNCEDEFFHANTSGNKDFNRGWKAACEFVSTALIFAMCNGNILDAHDKEDYSIQVSKDGGETWIPYWTVNGKPKTFPTARAARNAWNDEWEGRECEWEHVRVDLQIPITHKGEVNDVEPYAYLRWLNKHPGGSQEDYQEMLKAFGEPA